MLHQFRDAAPTPPPSIINRSAYDLRQSYQKRGLCAEVLSVLLFGYGMLVCLLQVGQQVLAFCYDINLSPTYHNHSTWKLGCCFDRGRHALKDVPLSADGWAWQCAFSCLQNMLKSLAARPSLNAYRILTPISEKRRPTLPQCIIESQNTLQMRISA